MDTKVWVLKKRLSGWLIFNVVCTIFFSLSVFPLPLSRDQGIFSYVADGILKGLSPYKYSFDIKPPFVFFIYAFSFLLFGKSPPSVYLIDLIYRIATLLAIYYTGKKLYGERAGLTASLLYGIFSSFIFNRLWRVAQAETFMVLPLVLVCYFFVDSVKQEEQEKNKKHFFPVLCGFFSGVAFMIKYSAAFIVISLPLFWLSGKSLKKPFLFIAGFTIALLPFLMYFYYHQSLYDLYLMTVKFNFLHIEENSSWQCWRYVQKLLIEGHFLAIFSLLFVFLRKKNNAPLFYKLLLWWLSLSFLSVAIQGKFWTYHWIIFLGPLSLMAGWQVVWFYENFVEGKGCGRKAIMIFCYTIFFLSSLKTNHIFYRISENIKYLRGEISRAEFFLPFDKLSNNVSFSNAEAMAEYIKNHTDRNDTVWIFGHESIVYFLSDRRAPTRFQWDYPLTIDTSADSIKKQFLQICLEEINRKKPEIIFIIIKDTNPIERENSVTQWNKIPELVEFLSRNYYFVEKKYNALIYFALESRN